MIADDTVLLPELIAHKVLGELESFLAVELSEAAEEYLANKAEDLYARNRTFAKNLHQPGTGGRDTLYMFMRHWLAGWVKDHRPNLYERIPKQFKNGQAP